MTYPKGYTPPSAGDRGGERIRGGKKRLRARNTAIVLLVIFSLFIIMIVAGSATKSSRSPSPPSQSAAMMETTSESESGDDNESSCDSSYPDVCIPSYPPDLNCADVSEKRFSVIGSDPHGFDGDYDDIGCKS
ncbi:MAG: hypothetical protein L0H53_08755 [Candidatus Nitrosocosmicus sp.]|nr:hypothetical protein [Candidatus Nitrosocosmicus sp.]MDN5868405.1 hypothetical protein [Candidatus Nitrosocosmicus sp.]